MENRKTQIIIFPFSVGTSVLKFTTSSKFLYRVLLMYHAPINGVGCFKFVFTFDVCYVHIYRYLLIFLHINYNKFIYTYNYRKKKSSNKSNSCKIRVIYKEFGLFSFLSFDNSYSPILYHNLS